MAETVRLLSVKGRAQLIERFYFYDGEVPIVGGVVEIPAGRPEWVQRAYIMGYRFDPETEEILTLDEALAGGKVAAVAPGPEETQETESTESAGEDIEGSFSRGQSPSEDGVRESELPGDGSIPEAGMDSGVGDGDVVLGTGEPAE